MSTRHWWCTWRRWRLEADIFHPRYIFHPRSRTCRCSLSPQCTPHSGCCRTCCGNLWCSQHCSRNWHIGCCQYYRPRVCNHHWRHRSAHIGCCRMLFHLFYNQSQWHTSRICCWRCCRPQICSHHLMCSFACRIQNRSGGSIPICDLDRTEHNYYNY